MKIQEGKVKYGERDDIICLYGVLDDGKQYYFIKKLENGNYIASNVLVEAIDPMYKASNIGVIDGEGKEVIPFNNKSIKLVTDHEDILVAELATPISESVIEANQQRNDPLSATKLVSTASTIKEKVNAETGPEGRYIYSDVCSEATVFNWDGENLVNGEYYSFVGYCKNNLYLAKNTIDTEVKVLSLSKENEVVNNVNEGFGSEDLSQVTLSDDQIVQEEVQPVEDVIEEAPIVQEDVQPVEEVAIQEEVQPVEETVEPVEEVVTQEVQPVEETVEPVEEVVTQETQPVEEPLGQEINIPEVEDNFEQEFTFNPEEISSIDSSIDVPEQYEEDITYNDLNKEDSELDGLFQTNSTETEDDYDSLINNFKADSIESGIEDDYYDTDTSKEESIVEEVSKTLSDLLDVNKDLENQNTDLKERNKELRDALKRASDSLSVEKKKNDAYKEKEYILKSELGKKEDELRKKDGRVKMVEASNEELQREIRKQRAIISKYEKEHEGLMSVLDTASEKIKVA